MYVCTVYFGIQSCLPIFRGGDKKSLWHCCFILGFSHIVFLENRAYLLRQSLFIFFVLFIYLFIYFWLHCVFVAERGLSLAAASGGAILCCGARASHCSGFSCCRARAQ